MAYKGKLVHNPVNRQSIAFITTSRDSRGERLEMLSTWDPSSLRPAVHYHPYQEEFFKVLEGELTIVLNGETKVLCAGESIKIPANATHAMWNSTDKKTVAFWEVTPAMKTEFLLETGAGLAANSKINEKGMPGILQVALMARVYNREFRLGTPSYPLQKLIFGILAPFAAISGKKATYPEYID